MESKNQEVAQLQTEVVDKIRKMKMSMASKGLRLAKKTNFVFFGNILIRNGLIMTDRDDIIHDGPKIKPV